MTQQKHKSAPIRILRIITRLNIGGPSIQAIKLSRRLDSAGFHTTLVHGQLGPDEGDMRTLLSTEGLDIISMQPGSKSLEEKFLETVKEARERGETTAGAEAGGALPPFLGGGDNHT